MKVTKYTTLAFTMAGCLLLSSCDSFLDIQPVGKVIPNTLSEYRSLLTKAYQQPFNDKAICDMRTNDVIIKDDNHEQGVYGEIERWNDGSFKTSTYSFNWEVYYSIIYYANAIIDNKSKIKEGSREEIDQLVGEAYFLRGYIHFILVNLYGEPYGKKGAPQKKAIPLKLDLDLEAIPTRNTVEEIYTAILDDIAKARTLINKETWEERYLYRFSVIAADAFASRVHLYMGKWEEAYAEAENALAKKSSLENLNEADSKMPNEYQSVEIINAYEQIQSSSTQRACWAGEELRKTYDTANDLRLKKYFGEPNKDGKYSIAKADGSSKYRCSFRTGEVYLNAAEAAARLNKLPEARKRLLQLMEKRYTPEGYAQKKKALDGMQLDELIKEILDERARELAFEGHRWFDLRRTTRPKMEKTLENKKFVLQQDDPRYTLRLPVSATEANPGLLN